MHLHCTLKSMALTGDPGGGRDCAVQPQLNASHHKLTQHTPPRLILRNSLPFQLEVRGFLATTDLLMLAVVGMSLRSRLGCSSLLRGFAQTFKHRKAIFCVDLLLFSASSPSVAGFVTRWVILHNEPAGD